MAKKSKTTSVKLYSNYYYRPQDQDPVCDYLRAARDKRPTKMKDITQHGITAGTVGRLFGGKTRSPKFTTVMVIARAIGPEAVEAVTNCVRNGGAQRPALRTIEGGRQKRA